MQDTDNHLRGDTILSGIWGVRLYPDWGCRMWWDPGWRTLGFGRISKITCTFVDHGQLRAVLPPVRIKDVEGLDVCSSGLDSGLRIQVPGCSQTQGIQVLQSGARVTPQHLRVILLCMQKCMAMPQCQLECRAFSFSE